jgi:hypothetical protein
MNVNEYGFDQLVRPLLVRTSPLILTKPDVSPFQSGALEVDDQADLQACDPQVVQHTSELLVADRFYGLRIDHN